MSARALASPALALLVALGIACAPEPSGERATLAGAIDDEASMGAEAATGEATVTQGPTTARCATEAASAEISRRTAPRAVRVRQVTGATSDAHDIAVVGARVLYATSGGLVIEHAGRVERVLTSLDGLPGTRLRSVSVTADGAWVGGPDGAALVRIGSNGAATVVRTLPLSRVRRVVDWQGDLWLGTQGGGLFRAAADGEPTPVPLGKESASRQVTDLLVHDGALFVATAGAGVFRLDPEGEIAARHRASGGLADDLVWDLAADGERLLVATANGLSVIRRGRVDPGAREALASRSLTVSDVRALMPARSELWLATFGGGVHKLGAGQRETSPVAGLEGASRSRALAVAGGGITVAHDAGVDRIGSEGGHFAVLSGGLPSSDVTALAHARGALWIGTFDRGLARTEGDRIVALNAPAVDRRVNDLAVTCEDGRETLWIATDGGLCKDEGETSARVTEAGAPTTGHITALHVEPATGDLWVASSRGVARRHEGRWSSWEADATTPLSQLAALTTDGAGGVWIGGLHGLFRLDPTSGHFRRFCVASGDLPVDWVTAVVPWDGGIAAGTYHGGLALSSDREADSFRIVREADGLPAGWVNPHAMTSMGGALWFGALDRGLVVGRDRSWRRVTIADGLPSADVTAILADGPGAAWVATRGGLAKISYE